MLRSAAMHMDGVLQFHGGGAEDPIQYNAIHHDASNMGENMVIEGVALES